MRDIGKNGHSGDEMLAALSALANPHRLRIIAALAGGTNYVSQLARDLGISRPLLHMHLQKLEAAGIVDGRTEISESGKAMRYYAVTEFAWNLDARSITRAVETLTATTTADGRTKGMKK